MQDTVRISEVMTNIKDTDIMMMTMIIMMKKISLMEKQKKHSFKMRDTFVVQSWHDFTDLPLYDQSVAVYSHSQWKRAKFANQFARLRYSMIITLWFSGKMNERWQIASAFSSEKQEEEDRESKKKREREREGGKEKETLVRTRFFPRYLESSSM